MGTQLDGKQKKPVKHSATFSRCEVTDARCFLVHVTRSASRDSLREANAKYYGFESYVRKTNFQRSITTRRHAIIKVTN